jgi:hypothetical protein
MYKHRVTALSQTDQDQLALDETDLFKMATQVGNGAQGQPALIPKIEALIHSMQARLGLPLTHFSQKLDGKDQCMAISLQSLDLCKKINDERVTPVKNYSFPPGYCHIGHYKGDLTRCMKCPGGKI